MVVESWQLWLVQCTSDVVTVNACFVTCVMPRFELRPSHPLFLTTCNGLFLLFLFPSPVSPEDGRPLELISGHRPIVLTCRQCCAVDRVMSDIPTPHGSHSSTVLRTPGSLDSPDSSFNGNACIREFQLFYDGRFQVSEGVLQI